ncbi:Na+/H+ antiporter subunit E [Streptomyces sp. NPDC005805]|uniref:Na+/H+ antiporter subunit E n=1 Tax=Streptomyces sp. NPDC005805 TaxID=3157068 RepID=UPI0034078BB3
MISVSFRNKKLPPYSCAIGTRHPRVLDLPQLAWLTAIWVLLWGTLTWANLLTGAIVSVVLSLAFPQPQVDLGLRLHPWGILRLTAYLTYDMFSSGVRVTRQIFAELPYRAAVIGIPLRCRGDLMLTLTAVSVSNMPGGSVVEVRRDTATLFLHILDAHDPAVVDAARRSVWRLEELTVCAFGTPDEIARVGRPPAAPPETRDTDRGEDGA